MVRDTKYPAAVCNNNRGEPKISDMANENNETNDDAPPIATVDGIVPQNAQQVIYDHAGHVVPGTSSQRPPGAADVQSNDANDEEARLQQRFNRLKDRFHAAFPELANC